MSASNKIDIIRANAIKDAVSLFKQVPEVVKKDHSKISDFFLRKIDNSHFDFVKKNSFCGFWLKLWHSLRKWVGLEDGSRINIKINLETVSNIFQEAINANTSVIDIVVREIKNEGKYATRKSVKSSVEKAMQVMAELEKYAVQHSHSPQSLANKIAGIITNISLPSYAHDATSRPQEKNVTPQDRQQPPQKKKEEISRLLLQLLSPNTTSSLIPEDFPLEHICIFLENCPEQDLLLSKLEKQIAPIAGTTAQDQEQKRKICQDIVAATVLHSLSLPHSPEERQFFQNLFSKICPAPKTTTLSPVSVHNIALVCGDQFIRETAFDGDVGTKNYADLTSQYIQQLPQSEQTAPLMTIKKMMENAIDLRIAGFSAAQLSEELHQRLVRDGSRCLLFGGWNGHAIVYEIERTSNNSYVFRVYNEGEGVSFLQPHLPKFSYKYSPCVAAKNITEENVFNPSFLTQLIAITTIPGERQEGSEIPGAASLLYTIILPALGGIVEPLPDDVQPAVSSQNSGTCAYRSLHAFFARYLSQVAFKKMKFGFQLFLFDQYVPSLEKEADEEIPNIATFEEKREKHAILSRSIAYLSKTFQKIASLTSDTEKDRTAQLIDRYTVLLERLQRKTLEYEKTIQQPGAFQRTIGFAPFTLPYDEAPSRVKKGDAPSGLLSQEEHTCAQLIDAIPAPTHPRYRETLKSALENLAQLPESGSSSTELYEAFIKKIPSPKTWESIRYDTVESAAIAAKNLQKIAIYVASNISSSLPSSTKLYLIVISAAYGAEQAFLQSTLGKHIAHTSFLGKHFVPCLLKIQISDPFWTAFKENLIHLASEGSTEEYINTEVTSQFKGKQLGLPMRKAIWSWWSDSTTESLRKKVSESIQKDRIRQKREIEENRHMITASIARLKHQLSQKKAELEVEENKLHPQKESALATDPAHNDQALVVQELRNELFHLEQMLQSRNNALASVESDVSNNGNHWPPGFELSEKQGGLPNLTYKAPFLGIPQQFFADQLGDDKKDLLPSELRDYFNMAALVGLIFSKTVTSSSSTDPCTPVKLELDFEERKETELLIRHTYSTDFTPNSPTIDVYINGIPDDEWQKEWYKETISAKKNTHKDTSEPCVPSISSAFLKARVLLTKCPEDILSDLNSIVSSKKIQIESTLAFFSENPGRLREEAWLNIFHALLFESNLLQESLFSPSGNQLVQNVQRFFNKALDQFAASTDFSSAANVMWLAKSVQRHIQKVWLEKGKSKADVPHIIDENRIVSLFNSGLDPRFSMHLPVLCEATLASCIDAIQDMPSATSEPLFACASLAFAILQSNPVPQTKVCIPRSEEASDAQFALKRYMTEASLSDAPAVPQNIAKVMNTHLQDGLQKFYPNNTNISVVSTSNPVTFKIIDDKSHLLSTLIISSGTLLLPETSESGFTRILPQNVRFELKRHLNIPENEYSNMRCRFDGDVVYVKDYKRNMILRLHKKQYSFAYEVDLYTKDHDWLQLVPCTNELTKNTHLDEYYFRGQQGDTVYFLNKSTLQVAYQSIHQILNDDECYIVQPTDRQDGFVVATGSIPSITGTFESETHSIYLKQNDVFKEIRFPRHGITLVEEGGEWLLSDDKSWRLAKGNFIPNLGNQTGFLLFTNDQGAMRAMIPIWDPDTETQPSKRLTRQYAYNYDEKSHCARHLEYTVNGQLLIPQNPEGRFYLARIYAENGHIDEAEVLLNSHEAHISSRPLSQDEVLMLTKLVYGITSKNIEPRLCRLRLHAMFLLLHNKHVFSKNEAFSCFNKLPQSLTLDMLRRYLTHLSSIPPLDIDEEIFLIQNLEDCYDNAIKKRLAFLSGEKLPPPIESPPKFAEGFSKLLWTIWDPPPVTALDLAANNRYDEARRKNKFPFDPTTVKAEELVDYCRAMKKECSEISYKNAVETGLMQMLCHLSFFGSNELYIYKNENGFKTQKTSRKIGASLLRELLSRFYTERSGAVEAILCPSTHKDSIAKLAFEGVLRPLQRDLVFLAPMRISADVDWYLEGPIKKTIGQEGKVDTYFKTIEVRRESPPDIISKENIEAGIDSAMQKKFQETRDDIEVAKKDVACQEYRLRPDMDIGTLQTELEQKQKEAEKTLSRCKEILLGSIAHALTADQMSFAEFSAKKRTLPTIEDLCATCAKKYPKDFLQTTYPELSASGRKLLREKVCDYLLQKQFVQRLDRCIEQARALQEAKIGGADESTVENLENELGTALASHRSYDLSDENALIFLLIETGLNISLRKKQVVNINAFAKDNLTDHSTALQMIMGSGKTSVIQPILSFLLAEPGYISVIDVPESLLEPVRENLTKILGSAFHQYVYSLDYDRSKAKDISFLRMYLEQLKRVENGGRCILRGPRIKHSIITSFYEALHDHCADPINNEKEEKLQLISSIVSLLQCSEKVQIDEVDTTLDPMVIFKYPIGTHKTIDVGRAELAAELLFDLVDSDIGSSIGIDFVNTANVRSNKGFSPTRPITQKLFEGEVKKRLANFAIKRLESQLPSLAKALASGVAREKLLNFLTNGTPFDAEIRKTLSPTDEALRTKELLGKPLTWNKSQGLDDLIVQKLQYRRDLITWITKTIPSSEERQLVGVCAHAIRDILPISLLKECGAHYGKDPEPSHYIARPYAAPKCPKPTVYSDPYEQVIYSVQQLIYYGISQEATEQLLKNLQTDARNDISCGTPLQQTQGMMNFKKILGPKADRFSFFDDPPQANLISALREEINKNREFLMFFAKSFLFPQIKVYPQSISSTPQTLAASSDVAFGYSGTLATGILPQGMKAIPEQGTDGKTILAVEEKMRQGLATTTVLKDPPLEQIFQQFSSKEGPHVFIDSGGWLKEESTASYARRLLEACALKRPEIHGVVYHNERGEIVCLEYGDRNSLHEHPLSQSKRVTTDGSLLTIIAQRYETGTDITQIPTAKAVVSIRKNMTKRDCLQSVFRMRQILRMQTASFVMTQEVHDHVASGIWQGILQRSSDVIHALGSKDPVTALKTFGLLDNSAQALVMAQNEWKKTKKGQLRFEHLPQLENDFIKNLSVNSTSLWRYFTANEGVAEQTKHWLACQQRMRELIERPLRETLSNCGFNIAERRALFLEVKGLFTQSLEDDPFGLVAGSGMLCDTETAIDQLVAKFSEYVRKIKTLSEQGNTVALYALEMYGNMYPPKTTESLDASVRLALQSCANTQELPSVVEVTPNQIGQELEVEIEQEQEQQVQLQVRLLEEDLEEKPYQPLVNEMDGNYPPKDLAFSLSRDFPTTILPLNNAKTAEGDTLIETSLDAQMFYSQNLFLDGHINSPYSLAGRYLLAIKTPYLSHPRYILLSHEDADKVKHGLHRLEAPLTYGESIVLFDLDGDPIVEAPGSTTFFAPYENELHLARALAKLTTGKVSFSPEEGKALLQEIERTPELAAKRKKLLKKYYEDILKTRSAAAARYPGSWIQRTLKA